MNKFHKYLCPPGNGVYTVHTASERKANLHERIYQTSNLKEVQLKWEESLATLSQTKQPCLIGATMDTGGGILRGCNWGPLFLRQFFKSSKYFDIGDIRTIPHLLHDKYLNDETLKNCREALYADKNSTLPVSPLSILEDFSHEFFRNYSQSLITLGGDHSISYPVVSQWIQAQQSKGEKVAIIHFDAHTDLLDKRLGIDLCFGSWAYHCLDLLERPDHLIQLGIRSSGKTKEYWESTLGIKQYWSQEILDSNTGELISEIKNHLKEQKITKLYLSFDIDALDTEYASSTGTPEPDGLTPQICTQIIEAFKFHSADLVEVSPFLNTQANINNLSGDSATEPNRTLDSAKVIFESMIRAIQE